MEEMERDLYFREIALQCKYALAAFDDLQRELQTLFAVEGRVTAVPAQLRPSERVFFHIQNFLVAAANVSKLFWPPKNSDPNKDNMAKGRSEELRQALSVPDNHNDSPVGARKLRNAFEHFDERLDDVRLKNASIFDMNVGAWAPDGETTPTGYLRNFDPATQTVTFMGAKPLLLLPLVLELQRLAMFASDLANGGRGPWWPDITAERLLDTATPILQRLLREKGMPDRPDDEGKALRPYQEALNEEVHRAFPTLPNDVSVSLPWGIRMWDRPGWSHIMIRVERDGNMLSMCGIETT